MTPDELVVLMLEQPARHRIEFRVENYSATRSAAERLLRTVGAVPSEPPKQIEGPRAGFEIGSHPALRRSVDSRTQLLPVYRPGHVYQSKVNGGS